MFVSSIVSSKGSKVVSALPTETVADLVLRLSQHRIGAILVRAADGSIAGIVSERDVVRALARRGADTLQQRVADIMVTDVETCEPEDTVDHVMETMTERRFRHLPVVQDGSIVGIISIGDVVKNLIDETRHEAEALKQYIVAG
jgi:CBS domain-containing protein